MMTHDNTEEPAGKSANQGGAPGPAIKEAVAPKPVRRRRAWVFQSYLIATVIAFVTLGFFAHSVNYFPVDLSIMRAVQTLNVYPIDATMRFLTWLGYWPQAPLLSALVVLVVYFVGLRWEAVMTLASVGGGSLVVNAAKLVVNRPRPDANLVKVFAHLGDTSFPSGHVMFYVSLAGFLWFLCYTLFEHDRRRTLALWLLGVTIVLGGLSRIYLGQHWPSDVLGAYLLGSIWLTLMISIYRWGKPRYFVTQPVAAEAPVPGAART